MISSHLNSLNARERQREMIAQADRQRRARQLGDVARASRSPARPACRLEAWAFATSWVSMIQIPEDESDLVTEVCWPVVRVVTPDLA
jgi:hypothetical protein